MTPELINSISAEAFRTVMYVAGPPLMVGLVIGLLVGFFQTITQIQEFTLIFVPKMVGVFACIFLLMPWMSDKLLAFATNLIARIPEFIR
jgi:flagellar biosynthetic protein FliQ